MYDRNRYSSEHAQCDEALLSVGEPVIFECVSHSLKHTPGIYEIKPVLLNVQGSGCAAALAAVRWLMAQFGNSTQTAIAAYVYHVRDGVDLPSVWEQLQSQLYLNDAEFAEVLGRKMHHKLVAAAEIPRLQRRTSAPPLAWLAAMPERNTAIVRGYATGCYTMKEIALAFEIHYATVRDC